MTRRWVVVIIITVLLFLGSSSSIAQQTKKLKERADSLFAKGQWGKAERAYRDLAEQSRGEERAYAEYKAGVCLAKQDRYPEAVGTWYKLFVYDKESEWSARAMEETAEISITQFQEKDKGIWLYEWLVERFPDRANSDEVLHKVAMLHFNDGDYTEALETFERVPREYPKSKLVGSAREYATRCRKRVDQPAREVTTVEQERPPGLAAENLPIPSHLEGFIIRGRASGGETEFIKVEDCPSDAQRRTVHCKTSGSVRSRHNSCPCIYPVQGEGEKPRHFTDTDGNIWIPIWGTWREKWANGITCFDENFKVIIEGGGGSPHSWTEVDYCIVVPDHFSR